MNKKIVVLLTLSALLVVYWFILRPVQIRKDCYNSAYSTPNLGDTKEWVTATDYYYTACLHRNGLEK